MAGSETAARRKKLLHHKEATPSLLQNFFKGMIFLINLLNTVSVLGGTVRVFHRTEGILSDSVRATVVTFTDAGIDPMSKKLIEEEEDHQKGK